MICSAASEQSVPRSVPAVAGSLPPWSALPDVDPAGVPFDPDPDPPTTDPADPPSSGTSYPAPGGEPATDPSEDDPTSVEACAAPPPARFRSTTVERQWDGPDEALLLV